MKFSRILAKKSNKKIKLLKFWTFYNVLWVWESVLSIFWARFRLFLNPDPNSAWTIILFCKFRSWFHEFLKFWGSPPAAAAAINPFRALTSQREAKKIGKLKFPETNDLYMFEKSLISMIWDRFTLFLRLDSNSARKAIFTHIFTNCFMELLGND